MRARVLLLVVLLGVVPAVWIGACLLVGPSDGTLVMSARPDAWEPDGIRISQVYGGRSELRAGDVVTAIDGVSVADADGLAAMPVRHDGDHLIYEVRRDGGRVELDVVLGRYPIRAALLDNLPAILLTAGAVAVTGFLFVRRPRDWVARLLVAMALLLELGGVAWPLGAQAIDLAGGRGAWPVVGGEVAFAAMWAAWVLLPLIAPTPYPWVRRHPGPVVAAVLAVPLIAYGVRLLLGSATTGIERYGQVLSVSWPAARLLPLPIVIGLVLSVRRTGTGADQRGVRLLLSTMAASMTVFLVAAQLPLFVGGAPLVAERWQPFVLVACPVAVLLAILRYRLFDIDVIIRRSLVHGLVSVGLLISYLVSCVVIGGVLGWSSPAWIVGGAIAAVAFQPLRNRLRALAGRVAFGARENPYEVLSRLGEQVERADAPEEVLPVVVDTLSRALRLSYAAIELRAPDGSFVVGAARGVEVGRATVMPLQHGGEVVGRLRVELVSGVEPFNRADERLLADLARQVASAVRLVQLNGQLQRSLDRVVRIREAERRRLARDLHDGLGPTLAAGIIQLGVARAIVRDDPSSAERLLDGIADAAQDMVVDVRRIVDDLQPLALDELGLVAAIEQRAQYFADVAGPGVGTMDVAVVATGDLRALPPAVELAAFRIVLEALHNASRHGGASLARVELLREEQLEVTVVDDGAGLDPGAPPRGAGVGLASMRARAAELGGTLAVGRRADGGTSVRAVLPVLDLVGAS